jgi:hypothetical protein
MTSFPGNRNSVGMTQLSLIVDGMLSGTGVRDASNGGYLELHEIGISDILRRQIGEWLSHYEDAHFQQYCDSALNDSLDQEGIKIAGMIKLELPVAKVRYFSSAYMKEIKF